MIRLAALIVAALFIASLPAAPATAQGACPFCETNPPPNGGGNGGGRPGNGPGSPGNGNGNGNGNGGGNGQQADLQIETDIDFGRLVTFGSGPGTVVIDLQTGTRVVTGGLDELGGLPMAGRAVITGRPMSVVRVTFPNSITMTDIAGNSATLRDFTTDLPALPVLDTSGTLTFNFSGRLVADRVQGGDYRGRIPISVAYD
ncbi:MAG: DUF4402 domain-containing protein [Sphingomonadaceae bacterium]|nr:DUF4402 domain-containing protein [Sphingomonadaceae bacterium]